MQQPCLDHLILQHIASSACILFCAMLVCPAPVRGRGVSNMKRQFVNVQFGDAHGTSSACLMPVFCKCCFCFHTSVALWTSLVHPRSSKTDTYDHIACTWRCGPSFASGSHSLLTQCAPAFRALSQPGAHHCTSGAYCRWAVQGSLVWLPEQSERGAARP